MDCLAAVLCLFMVAVARRDGILFEIICVKDGLVATEMATQLLVLLFAIHLLASPIYISFDCGWWM